MTQATVLRNLPRVGIRPAIDGRLGGVRESLERQTVALAESAATLISSRLQQCPAGDAR